MHFQHDLLVRVATVVFIGIIISCDGYDYADHPCRRKCDESTEPYVCKYYMTIETYPTLSPACGNCPTNETDCYKPHCIVGCGAARMMCTINRKIQGPLIEVCKGDTIQVVIKNHMTDSQFTMHWHGINMEETPYMDGPPHVNQCPISAGETFVYTFKPKRTGTYWYHSHVAVESYDGCLGPLIVKGKTIEDPLRRYYNAELRNPILLSDYFCDSAARDKLPGLRGVSSTSTILINGKGVFKKNGTPQNIFTSETIYQSPVNPAIFRAPPEKSVKIRIIFGLSACQCCVSISKHRLTVIELDGGHAIQPRTVQGVCGGPGERVAFVIQTQGPGTYWIKVTGVGPCPNVTQVALLEVGDSNVYPDHPPPLLSNAPKSLLNYPSSGCSNPSAKEICISELKALHDYENSSNLAYKRNILLAKFSIVRPNPFSFFRGDYYHHFFGATTALVGQINNIAYVPASSPLLTQYCDVPKRAFCSDKCLSGDYPGECYCLAVYKFPLHKNVYIFASEPGNNTNGVYHPMHLHGYDFKVAHSGYYYPGPREPQDQEIIRKIHEGYYDRPHCPVKDTLLIPAAGYNIIVFKASNPGFWMLHCHIFIHHDAGMAAVIQIGEIDEMKKAPSHFPKCGNYFGDYHYCKKYEDADEEGHCIREPNPMYCPKQHHCPSSCTRPLIPTNCYLPSHQDEDDEENPY